MLKIYRIEIRKNHPHFLKIGPDFSTFLLRLLLTKQPLNNTFVRVQKISDVVAKHQVAVNFANVVGLGTLYAG